MLNKKPLIATLSIAAILFTACGKKPNVYMTRKYIMDENDKPFYCCNKSSSLEGEYPDILSVFRVNVNNKGGGKFEIPHQYFHLDKEGSSLTGEYFVELVEEGGKLTYTNPSQSSQLFSASAEADIYIGFITESAVGMNFYFNDQQLAEINVEYHVS